MRVATKFLIIILFACFQMHSFGQLMLDDVRMERIHQKKIRKYLKGQIKEGKHQFSDIHPSWTQGKDLSSYRKKEKAFFLKGNIQDIWQGYISMNPSNSWNCRKVSFGLLLKRFPGRIFYNHDPIDGVDTGQVYYLNLKLMLGICNLAVAFEIITLDEDQKVIEFSYLEGNKSRGVQRIRFVDLGNNQTEIIHASYFTSGSHFRDKYLYPFFHNEIINNFHRNMRKLLNLEEEHT